MTAEMQPVCRIGCLPCPIWTYGCSEGKQAVCFPVWDTDGHQNQERAHFQFSQSRKQIIYNTAFSPSRKPIIKILFRANVALKYEKKKKKKCVDICYDDQLGEQSGNRLIVFLFICIKSKFHILFGTNVFPEADETFNFIFLFLF